jgi:molecular chaperone DnaJ
LAGKQDYYEVLGVSRDASADDIRKAYRRLAKQHHPDANTDNKDTAAEKFKEVSEAYSVLSDDQKRRQYDTFGHAAFENGGGGGGFGGFGDFMGGFGDIFDTFFGGGASSRSRTGPVRGADLRMEMRITFEEAAFGVEREISLNKDVRCDTCGGTGAKPGTSPRTCATCGGTGQMRQQRNTAFGSFMNVVDCPDCGGRGTIIKETCPDCGGRGIIKQQRKIKANIPAGIDNGQILNMRGEGAAGQRGGMPGDLQIYISVQPHKFFTREGYDLHLEMPVTIVDAALGAELVIPTLEGNVKYKMGDGTQTGTVFRLKDKGIQHLNSSRKGSLFVRIRVDTPQKLNEKQKELLRQFEKLSGKKEKGFFEQSGES